MTKSGCVAAAYGLSRKLRRMLNACKSQKEARELMRRLGFVETSFASIAEAYHDAVRRGDDPDEIAWLKAQWLRAEKESMQ